jgi:hypothetical protein
MSMIERARQIANKRYPLPDADPIWAGVRAAMVVAVIIAALRIFDDFLTRNWAEGVTIVLCGLVAFADCRQRWNLNARMMKEALEYIRDTEGQA